MGQYNLKRKLRGASDPKQQEVISYSGPQEVSTPNDYRQNNSFLDQPQDLELIPDDQLSNNDSSRGEANGRNYENSSLKCRPKTAEQFQLMCRIYDIQSTEHETKHKTFKSARFFRGGTQGKSSASGGVDRNNAMRRSHPI